MLKKYDDKPRTVNKFRVYKPANESQRAWGGGYGYDAAQIAKFKHDAKAKEQALRDAHELANDVVMGIL
jgi:hypothetical protein